MQGRWWGLAIVFLVGFAILMRNTQKFPTTSIVEPITQDVLQAGTSSPTPTITSGAFAELTIPYLRSRTYESQLGQLRPNGQNANYSSYLTSYDSDGLKINGLLTKPTSEVPAGGFPAIVFVHGYIPPAQYRTTQNYADYVAYLARNGFVVFKIDLRGHDQSEGEAGGGYYSGDYIIDVLNARAALGSSGFVDPQKIGLWGHSMSGNVTFRAFTATGDIPAIVIWAGAVYTYEDFGEYGISDGSYQAPPSNTERARKRRELFEKYGQFNPQSDFWKQVVPTNYLEGVRGAIQINHATNDPVVSIEFSRNLMNILDNTPIPHELYEYPSGGHNLSGSAFTQAMGRTVEFFKSHLGK